MRSRAGSAYEEITGYSLLAEKRYTTDSVTCAIQEHAPQAGRRAVNSMSAPMHCLSSSPPTSMI